MSRDARRRSLDATVLAVDEVRDQVHRARTVERHHRDDVLDALGLELLERVPHPRRLQLEHAERPGLGRGAGRSWRRRAGSASGSSGDPARLLDQAHRVGDHGQRPEPQEVHLEQAELLDGPHRRSR